MARSLQEKARPAGTQVRFLCLWVASADQDAPLVSSHAVNIVFCSGLHESLRMTVRIPLLWGVPPRHEALRYDLSAYVCKGPDTFARSEIQLAVCSTAIACGGGFVEKVYKQWQLYG